MPGETGGEGPGSEWNKNTDGLFPSAAELRGEETPLEAGAVIGADPEKPPADGLPYEVPIPGPDGVTRNVWVTGSAAQAGGVETGGEAPGASKAEPPAAKVDTAFVDGAEVPPTADGVLQPPPEAADRPEGS